MEIILLKKISTLMGTYRRFTLRSTLIFAASIIVLVARLFLLLTHVETILLRDIVIAFGEALALALTSSEFASFALLTILKHFNVRLEFTVLLNGFQQLYRNKSNMSESTYGIERDFQFREHI